jgi:hypothetical protein
MTRIRLKIDKDDLRERYETKGETVPQIAKIYACHVQTIYNYLEEYGIPKRWFPHAKEDRKLLPLTPEFLNYLAGFFDGEGCISPKKQKEVCYSIILNITNINEQVMRYIYQNLGIGKLYKRRQTTNNFKKGPFVGEYWHFVVWRRNEVVDLLQLLAPKLIVKQQQALQAIETLERNKLRRSYGYARHFLGARARLKKRKSFLDENHD